MATANEERIRIRDHYGCAPERRVVRVDKSPMNPSIKVVQLNCGHDVFRQRAPRIDGVIVCPECARIQAGR